MHSERWSAHKHEHKREHRVTESETDDVNCIDKEEEAREKEVEADAWTLATRCRRAIERCRLSTHGYLEVLRPRDGTNVIK